MTKQTVLYTEMIVDRSVEHNVGLREVKLRLDEWERPCVVQFGGSDPELLARVARMAVEEYGHEEININVGCPSGRATGCSFGASLMKNPDLVARIVERVKNEVAGLSRHGVNSRSGSVPVTVKHRIGVDQMDSYEELCHFVRLLESAGCDHFIVHARKALLNLKLAKKNRTIPVLNYDMAYALKKDFPNSLFTINGGIKTLEEARKHLEIMDGVMIGRAASANPVMFLKADEEIWGTGSFERVNESIPTRENKEKGTETVSRIKDESHYQQLKHMYNHNDQVTIQKVLTEYAEWADEQILAGKVPHQHALAAFLTMAGAFRNGKALRRSKSGGRGSDLAINSRTITNNLRVNSARNAVVHLNVQLGQGIGIIDRSFHDITESSLFNNVTDQESLDGLVLRDAASAVGASHGLNVTTPVLVAPIISSLLSLLK
eukprot:Nk52_evm48s621 gene=Nk52_evmTU48s621